MEKKIYNSIDIAKFFFCFCIIALHTSAFKDIFNEQIYWYVEHYIYRLAVPFFFVSSGFFLGLKIKNTPSKLTFYIKSYIKRLLIPLMLFEVINIILEITKMILNGINYKVIAHNVIFSVVFYPYGALWYVQASIVAICLLYFFINKKIINIALLIGILLYMFALISNSYYFLVHGTILGFIVDKYLHICLSARNGLFVGFLFVGQGIWISNNIEILQKRNNRKYLILCLIISLITLFMEVSFIHGKKVADDSSMFLSLVILTPIILILLSLLNCSINTKISLLLRNLSVGMFYLHRIILSCILIVCMIGKYSIPSIATFIIVYITCVLICLISYKYEKKALSNLLK